jgi:hypothetical protein
MASRREMPRGLAAHDQRTVVAIASCAWRRDNAEPGIVIAAGRGAALHRR